MFKFEVTSNLKKYKELDGYQCTGYSSHSVLIHLSYKFNIPEFEIKKAFYLHKITIRIIGGSK